MKNKSILLTLLAFIHFQFLSAFQEPVQDDVYRKAFQDFIDYPATQGSDLQNSEEIYFPFHEYEQTPSAQQDTPIQQIASTPKRQPKRTKNLDDARMAQIAQQTGLPQNTVVLAFKYFISCKEGIGQEPATKEIIIDYARRYSKRLEQNAQRYWDKRARINSQPAGKKTTKTPLPKVKKRPPLSEEIIKEHALAYAKWLGLESVPKNKQQVEEYAQRYDLYVKKIPHLKEDNRAHIDTFDLEAVAKNMNIDLETVKRAFDYARIEGLKAPTTKELIEYYSERLKGV